MTFQSGVAAVGSGPHLALTYIVMVVLIGSILTFGAVFGVEVYWALRFAQRLQVLRKTGLSSAAGSPRAVHAIVRGFKPQAEGQGKGRSLGTGKATGAMSSGGAWGANDRGSESPQTAYPLPDGADALSLSFDSDHVSMNPLHSLLIGTSNASGHRGGGGGLRRPPAQSMAQAASAAASSASADVDTSGSRTTIASGSGNGSPPGSPVDGSPRLSSLVAMAPVAVSPSSIRGMVMKGWAQRTRVREGVNTPQAEGLPDVEPER